MCPAPNDDRPTPATPLRLCKSWYIRAACLPCGRSSLQSLADIAGILGHRAAPLPLRRIADRLRCTECGAAPHEVSVVTYDEGMRAVFGVVRPRTDHPG
jgi:hypothetical protein